MCKFVWMKKGIVNDFTTSNDIDEGVKIYKMHKIVFATADGRFYRRVIFYACIKCYEKYNNIR